MTDLRRTYRRRSVRMPSYDYSQPGAYFVTICAARYEALFGMIADGQVRLNGWGRCVLSCWQALPAHFLAVQLGEHIVMPDHLHGLIIIGETLVGRGTACCAPTRATADPLRRFGHTAPGSLPVIVRAFKGAVTGRIRDLAGSKSAVIWQRGYYEHVVRDENELQQITRYIAENPLMWQTKVSTAAAMAESRRAFLRERWAGERRS